MLLSDELVGYVAAGLTTASFFPQAVKTLRSGDTKAISLGMYALFTSGVALWSLYGLLVNDGPVLVANQSDHTDPCGGGAPAQDR